MLTFSIPLDKHYDGIKQMADQKPILLVIAGPTGAGKSALALSLAQIFHGEIVNCDSLQVYRHLNIGTAKTPVEERRGIPHHLIDGLELQEGFSAGEFGRCARQKVAEIASGGGMPIVVGGTGFYLNALLSGLPALPARDEAVRRSLVAREAKRPGALRRLLQRLDPESFSSIYERDVQKSLRALEVRILTGRSRNLAKHAAPLEGYRILKLGLDPERALLLQRLETRTLAMFREGLLDEVRSLLATGATGEEKPFESLGYKQALQHLRGEITVEQAIESTVIATRQYAKRQLTWFRRDPDMIWLKGFGDSAEILNCASERILALQ